MSSQVNTRFHLFTYSIRQLQGCIPFLENNFVILEKSYTFAVRFKKLCKNLCVNGSLPVSILNFFFIIIFL